MIPLDGRKCQYTLRTEVRLPQVELSELEMHLICALLTAAKRERHGWAIKQWLERNRKMEVRLTTIYRSLQRLTQAGLLEIRHGEPVESLAGSTRKYYRLTEKGTGSLEAIVTRWDERLKAAAQSVEEIRGAIKGGVA